MSDVSRREFVALGVGALVVASIPLASRRRFVVQRTVPVMGSLADLTVVHRDHRYAHAAIDAAVARLRRVDDLMTRFRDGSDVGRANMRAAREGVSIDAETAFVLSAALDWADRTGGAFDPGLGRLIRLWDVEYRDAPPAEDAVRRLAGRGLYHGLDVSRWQGRPAVRFTNDDLAIDLGGIAAGYGVDQAVATLRARGIGDAIVNLSGDLYAMGRSEDGNPWRVGIRSPDRADRIVSTIEVEDAAVTTSGDYVKFFQYQGRRYHHLLDPETGAPRVTGMHSITVKAADCMTADAAATACFGHDETRRHRWLAGTSADLVHSA
jgi:thiamine biosynthesis lipoprotein